MTRSLRLRGGCRKATAGAKLALSVSWKPFPASPQPLEARSMNARREFLKKALYVTPVILTASIRPTFAGARYAPPSPNSPTGGGGAGGRGGDKDAHDWWQFWRKL